MCSSKVRLSVSKIHCPKNTAKILENREKGQTFPRIVAIIPIFTGKFTCLTPEISQPMSHSRISPIRWNVAALGKFLEGHKSARPKMMS